MAQIPSLRGGTADGGVSAGVGGDGESKAAGAPAGSAGDEKAAKMRKALIEKLALAQEVQRLVMGKRIRPLLITEVSRCYRYVIRRGVVLYLCRQCK